MVGQRRSGPLTLHLASGPLARRVGALLLSALVVVGCSSGSRSKSAATSSAAGAVASTTNSAAPISSNALPANAGAFSAGPDLINARGQHSATLLADGRVLVVGGADGSGTLAESEVFDPLTTTWQRTRDLVANPNDGLMIDATGQFPTARQLHAALRLDDANKRVLIAGGVGIERIDAQGQPVFEVLRSAYTFDPTTNTFSPVADLPAARVWHLSAMTPAGEPILAGGLDANLTSTPSVAVFDPSNDTWSTSALQDLHSWGAVVTLSNRALAISGGDVAQGNGGNLGVASMSTQRVESIGAGGAVTPGPDNGADLIFASATALPGDGVFLAGGQVLANSQFTVTDQTEVFDPASGTWSAGSPLDTARYQHQALAVGSQGEVLIVGGVDSAGQALTRCELFVNGSPVGTSDLAIPRVDHRVVLLGSGQALVVGGFDAQTQAIAQTELYTR